MTTGVLLHVFELIKVLCNVVLSAHCTIGKLLTTCEYNSFFVYYFSKPGFMMKTEGNHSFFSCVYRNITSHIWKNGRSLREIPAACMCFCADHTMSHCTCSSHVWVNEEGSTTFSEKLGFVGHLVHRIMLFYPPSFFPPSLNKRNWFLT